MKTLRGYCSLIFVVWNILLDHKKTDACFCLITYIGELGHWDNFFNILDYKRKPLPKIFINCAWVQNTWLQPTYHLEVNEICYQDKFCPLFFNICKPFILFLTVCLCKYFIEDILFLNCGGLETKARFIERIFIFFLNH